MSIGAGHIRGGLTLVTGSVVRPARRDCKDGSPAHKTVPGVHSPGHAPSERRIAHLDLRRASARVAAIPARICLLHRACRGQARVSHLRAPTRCCTPVVRNADSRFGNDGTQRDSYAREPSAAYLRPNRRWGDELISSIRGLPRWSDRLRLLREVTLPGPTYMLRAYGFVPSSLGLAWLPVLYLHRLSAVSSSTLYPQRGLSEPASRSSGFAQLLGEHEDHLLAVLISKRFRIAVEQRSVDGSSV
jgi:hypothetical protein